MSASLAYAERRRCSPMSRCSACPAPSRGRRRHHPTKGIGTNLNSADHTVADGRNPDTTTVEEIFSRDLVAAAPADSVRRVIDLMEDLKVRRLPVVEADRAIGIVSLGDLAVETNVGSALAEISAAAPDR